MQVIVYGLSGKSGTGKSYNAIDLCSRLEIPALIDDGLYIYKNKVVAGESAKKQDTKVGAIKTAVFTKDAQRDAVAAAIKSTGPDKILILGTSDRMVDSICERLGLPEPTEHIHIEDISTKEQIAKAGEHRKKGGMHTIPAPTFELKRQFSGYFLNASRSFKKKRGMEEKTIVRPTYSYLGSFNISDKVIKDIVNHAASLTGGNASILFCSASKQDDGMYIRVIITAAWGARLRALAEQLQRVIYEDVAKMTNFNILGVEIELRGYYNNVSTRKK